MLSEAGGYLYAHGGMWYKSGQACGLRLVQIQCQFGCACGTVQRCLAVKGVVVWVWWACFLRPAYLPAWRPEGAGWEGARYVICETAPLRA